MPLIRDDSMPLGVRFEGAPHSVKNDSFPFGVQFVFDPSFKFGREASQRTFVLNDATKNMFVKNR
jgi:hypothetical protein